MSAKVTVIIYILISFEVGILLLILPWYSQFWEENFFLYLMTDRFHAPWLPNLMASGWVRGGVTGLGIVNILLGILEIINFRQRVDDLAERPATASLPESERSGSGGEVGAKGAIDESLPDSDSLSDQQQSGLPPRT